jgi:hypothetical protein
MAETSMGPQYVLCTLTVRNTGIDDLRAGKVTPLLVGLGGIVVIVLAIGPKVRGFKPGRRQWIFKGDKSP